MGEIPEIELHIRESQQQQQQQQQQESNSFSNGTTPRWNRQRLSWIIIAMNIVLLLAGQTVGTLLGRLYYDKGGNSKWMATIVQSAGFPVLFLTFFLFPSSHLPLATKSPMSYKIKIIAIYMSIGLIVAGDNLMYSYGLLYVPVSTYSLICASQLAFNSIFSYLLNNQKFTPLILNSVVLLTFSASLLGFQSHSEDSPQLPKGKYGLGFILTIAASAVYSLMLSLMQLSFQKVFSRHTFAIVIEMQISTSFVAACVSVLGLFVSGEWRTLEGEMEGFTKGKVSYVMILVWIAISWQAASIGIVGLVFLVSSLFSNVISTLALPIIPVFAVIFFHDKMDGVKVMAMVIAVWGFVSYLYQNYLDERREKKAVRSEHTEMDSRQM